MSLLPQRGGVLHLKGPAPLEEDTCDQVLICFKCWLIGLLSQLIFFLKEFSFSLKPIFTLSSS